MQKRTFTFSENGAGNQFCINGCQYDMSRVDTTVHVGDVEEWTLLNTSGEVHAFHIHQLDFLVTEVNGVYQNMKNLQDTVNLPFQVGDTPGEVKVIVPFFDPDIVGEFVYHCHILEHEDAGMMANILVLPIDPKAQKRILERVHKQMEHAHMPDPKAAPATQCIPCSNGEKK